MATRDHTRRIAELNEGGTAYVEATVVRAQCPTSTKPGDAAIVFGDGSIEGFVGGQCAQSSVRLAALDALASGEAVLLRILPEGAPPYPDVDGATTVVNPCLSGGAIEVFLEPRLPAPRLIIVGDTPIAEAVASLAPHVGIVAESVETVSCCGSVFAGATAAIISSHGRYETESIRAALDHGVGYVGLVASPKRGAAVIDELVLSADEAARVHSPVGIYIGARTAEEIALSILAGIVKAIRLDGLTTPGPVAGAAQLAASAAMSTSVDPVCGMTVIVEDTTPHLLVDGADVWFCATGCRDRYAAELAIEA